MVRAACETDVVVTAEEHQIGALAWRVSGILTESPQLDGLPVITGAIGVKGRFGDSGAPWELIKEFEVSARAHRAGGDRVDGDQEEAARGAGRDVIGWSALAPPSVRPLLSLLLRNPSG
jgi:hypothetical protein